MTSENPLTPEQIQEYRDAFAIFDTDNSGNISHEELGTIMRKLNQKPPTDVELGRMIAEVDTNKDGSINFEEFLNMMANKVEGVDVDEEIELAFKVFDVDGNGTISATELGSVMGQLGIGLTTKELKMMMDEADLNHDGEISLIEFKRMMASK